MNSCHINGNHNTHHPPVLYQRLTLRRTLVLLHLLKPDVKAPCSHSQALEYIQQVKKKMPNGLQLNVMRRPPGYAIPTGNDDAIKTNDRYRRKQLYRPLHKRVKCVSMAGSAVSLHFSKATYWLN